MVEEISTECVAQQAAAGMDAVGDVLHTEGIRSDVMAAAEGMAVHMCTHDLEASCASLVGRVVGLEALELDTPRASAFSVAGLQERVDDLAQHHARHACSIEDVVHAIVEDAAQLSRSGRAHAVALESQQLHHTHTREALLRCAAVFSQVLNIPSPVPLGALGAMSPRHQRGRGEPWPDR
ncbi:MAG: hypothetical protein WDW38_003765 [Sanguina aurantia]